jgi:hypothetical protein
MNRYATRSHSKTRFDAPPLTEDEMRKSCPSIFAETPHESRSLRFKPIPTIEVLRALKKEGFEPFSARQSTCRDPGKAPFTKHLIRLRQSSDVARNQVNDTVAEIALKNANDGTSAYDLLAALLKIRCLNGLYTAGESFEPVKVRHSGDVTSKVIEGTFRVLGDAQLALRAPELWAQQKLNRDEEMALAEAAHVLRFGDAEGVVRTAIRPEQLLEARREADRTHDLWTTFNRVQENVIRGGLHGRGPDANGKLRNQTTREVKGIDQDVRLNKALWVLAERMAQIKIAA